SFTVTVENTGTGAVDATLHLDCVPSDGTGLSWGLTAPYPTQSIASKSTQNFEKQIPAADVASYFSPSTLYRCTVRVYHSSQLNDSKNTFVSVGTDQTITVPETNALLVIAIGLIVMMLVARKDEPSGS
ncbi:MAG: hypothetical protein Q7R47_05960, partial [Candidatus Diapherotrites archaeon]|nr:hypothetical protein [Candidatus Diapherotrites archaeon]